MVTAYVDEKIINKEVESFLKTIAQGLNNLATASTQEKSTMTKLVDSNKKLIKQILVLASKLDSIESLLGASNKTTGGTQSNASVWKGKKLIWRQYELEGYCYSHGYRVTKAMQAPLVSSKTTKHASDKRRLPYKSNGGGIQA